MGIFFILFSYVIIVMGVSMKKKIIVILSVIFIILLIAFGVYLSSRHNYSKKRNGLNNLSYKVPREFEANIYDSYRSYHYSENNQSCSFSVDTFSTYSNKSGDDYLKSHVYFTLNDDIGKVEEVSINDRGWYKLEKYSSNHKSYYYATVVGDVGYDVEYTIYDYLNGDYVGNNDFCGESYEKIISSMKIK